MGEYFRSQLRELQEDYAFIGNVRGIGLMNTVEMVSDHETKTDFDPALRVQDRLGDKFYDRGMILRPVGQFLNISPPLCVTSQDIDDIVNILDDSLRELVVEVPQLMG